MLVVLMAIIDLSRTKIHAATRWLWLVLSGGLFVAAPIACNEEAQPEYGAPADVTVLDADEDPGLQPEYGPPGDIYIMETVYGPPLDYHEGDEGQPQDLQILYGPPPDYIESDEGQSPDAAMDAIQPLYGPVEIIDDVQPVDSVTPDLQILYGPPAK